MEDWLTQTDLAENGGDRPATNEPWPGISQTMCTGQSGMATTSDNGYVHYKPLKNKKSNFYGLDDVLDTRLVMSGH